VFADLKFHDIPETVRRAVANVRSRGATFLTVHGHRSVMEAAATEKGPMKILAVTVLTSFDQSDLDEIGATKTLEQLVLARAKGAVEAGCDGVIASGHEAAKLKAEFGKRLLVVTPGIRPAGTAAGDQKRRSTAEAFETVPTTSWSGGLRGAGPRACAAAIQDTTAKFASDWSSRRRCSWWGGGP
jgi:orotidine-5'-phosphate decarboxylase